jgi:hypothetical protein
MNGLSEDAEVSCMTADQTSDHRTKPERTTQDRRRPGRVERVSPELIGLLRRKPDARASRPGDREAGDDLGSARGILTAALVGVALWGAVFWVIHHVFH